VTLRKVLVEIAAEYARKLMPEPIADDLDACAAIAATMKSPVASSHQELGDFQFET
jgi:hypothetical protein